MVPRYLHCLKKKKGRRRRTEERERERGRKGHFTTLTDKKRKEKQTFLLALQCSAPPQPLPEAFAHLPGWARGLLWSYNPCAPPASIL